ncbi:hypothetical protein TVAG_302210 [Trichomonas vaginalis G3]|uniref:Uncharacterized protein n=1 Tax=Trichomonas vaginalis (strain ATCC PRA-98 / G3) TaxID=412133 RepID=A2EGP6_TRIV3|nr:hypothetical protein TVAGG3_0173130 [Trichomonas vaginalis G3]EAY08134.1 hypothetical protein TVAG_302210 [Trichomonas vaginalis G3]KAI5548735.1 hypothetical protein TVAGG3_0173130 [Trichomonas vaginalis G3]|eukprot:XP_001320357.1 hypothetical protein [Trichomonas vaginalis G3]
MKPKAKKQSFLTSRISNFEFGMTIIFSLVHFIIFYVCLPREKLPIPQNFNYYPQCMKCQRFDNSTIYSSVDDLILVFDYEKTHDNLNSFLQEVRSTGYIGKIVAFLNDESAKLEDAACGVKIIQTNKSIPKTVSNTFRKYIDAENYLTTSGIFANRVLLANASRLYFIKDPFQLISNPSKLLVLENPVSLLPFGFSNGECSNLWSERPTYFDSAIIGGGKLQVLKFLRAFNKNKDIIDCRHSDNEKVILTKFAGEKNFGNEVINFESLTGGNPDLSVDPEGFMIRTQFGTRYNNPNNLPTVIVDYQNSKKLNSIKQNFCNTK